MTRTKRSSFLVIALTSAVAWFFAPAAGWAQPAADGSRETQSQTSLRSRCGVWFKIPASWEILVKSDAPQQCTIRLRPRGWLNLLAQEGRTDAIDFPFIVTVLPARDCIGTARDLGFRQVPNGWWDYGLGCTFELTSSGWTGVQCSREVRVHNWRGLASITSAPVAFLCAKGRAAMIEVDVGIGEDEFDRAIDTFVFLECPH